MNARTVRFFKLTPFLRHLFSLYVLQVANYVLPFLLIPYLFQTLGAERYGLLAFASSLVWYFVILCNYSFDLTATRDIAVLRTDIEAVSRLFSSVLMSKVVLYISGLITMIILLVLVPQLRNEWKVFAVAYVMVAGFVFMPVWFFQGLEKMGLVSLLVFLSRVFYFVTVLLFVHNEDDFLLAMALQSAGVVMYGVIGLLLVRPTMTISWIRPSWSDIMRTLKDNWNVFISHVSTLLFSNSQVVIVGFISSHDHVAYYSIADKIVRAFAVFAMPVHQATYPRTSALMKESFARGFRYVLRIVTLAAPVYFIVCCLLFIWADFIVKVFVGEAAALPVVLLRVMSLLPLLSLFELMTSQLLLSLHLNQLYMKLTLTAVTLGLVSSVVLVSFIDSLGAAISIMIFQSTLILCLAGGFARKRPKATNIQETRAIEEVVA